MKTQIPFPPQQASALAGGPGYGNDKRKSFIAVAEAVPYRFLPILMSVLILGSFGCGYHGLGAAAHIPANVRTLAVPIFASKVQAYNTETQFTRAVVRELNTRTKYVVVTNGADADATLKGTILAETISPLTFDASSGQTSSYLVNVTTKVELVARNGTVLYRNDAFAWRSQYQSTQDFSGFVQEDSAAVRRMSVEFAQALVSDMLESFQ